MNHPLDRTKREVHVDQVEAKLAVIVIEYLMSTDPVLTEAEAVLVMSRVASSYINRVLSRGVRRE